MKVVSGVGIQEVIDEEKAGLGDYSDSDEGGTKKKSKRSKSSSSSSDYSGAGGSEDSSIDAGCEDDEEKLYQ